MTILEMQPGQWAYITGINRGSNAERRLFQMGLVPGARVKLVNCHPFHGPLILELGGAKIAVGRRLAGAVQVKNDIGK